MLKIDRSLLAGLTAMSLLCVAPGAAADDDRNQFRARLIGFDEVPAVSTTGRGRFSAQIRGDSVDWELTYERLEGTMTTGAHIHLAQKDVNGGIAVFFCGGGPTATPPCTSTSGSFRGTFTAADVIGPAEQGIAPGELAELIRAIRAGKTYVNVHTNKHPGGEIRGQVRGSRNDDDD